MINKRTIVLMMILSLTLMLTGCFSSTDVSNNDDDSDTSLTSDTGELALSLADAPVNNVAEVNVTLTEVQVHRSDEDGWETINDFDAGEKTFDLLTLRFDEELLGQQKLSTGTYDQIRLIVASKEEGTNPTTIGKSYVVYADGEEDSIFIPSGTQTGLKINHEFTIEEGKITRLLLDADVSTIMHSAGKSGKIILRPTAIDIVDKVVSGDIEGRVVADTDGDETTEAITEYDVMIEALQDGEVVKSTVATTEETELKDGTIKEAGSFKIRGLKEGSYDIKVKVVKEDTNGEIVEVTNSNDESLYTHTEDITAIEVTAEEVTPLDTITLQENSSTTE